MGNDVRYQSAQQTPTAPASAQRSTRRSALTRILIGTWKSISDDNISLLAAGVAFYALLAIFPGFAFIVAFFGLLADPADVQRQLVNVRGVLPAQAWDALNSQLLVLTRQSTVTLSLASIFSLLLAFINARLAAAAMMSALNNVYRVRETRSFVTTNAIALLFTVAAFAIFIFSVAVVIALPQLLSEFGLAGFSSGIIHTLKWPMLAVLMASSSWDAIPLRA